MSPSDPLDICGSSVLTKCVTFCFSHEPPINIYIDFVFVSKYIDPSVAVVGLVSVLNPTNLSPTYFFIAINYPLIVVKNVFKLLYKLLYCAYVNHAPEKYADILFLV